MLEKEKRPLLTNDSELDGLVSKFVSGLTGFGGGGSMTIVGYDEDDDDDATQYES